MNCVFVYWFREQFVQIAKNNMQFMDFIYPDAAKD
jgi:hypothetical protein